VVCACQGWPVVRGNGWVTVNMAARSAVGCVPVAHTLPLIAGALCAFTPPSTAKGRTMPCVWGGGWQGLRTEHGMHAAWSAGPCPGKASLQRWTQVVMWGSHPMLLGPQPRPQPPTLVTTMGPVGLVGGSMAPTPTCVDVVPCRRQACSPLLPWLSEEDAARICSAAACSFAVGVAVVIAAVLRPPLASC
jgi:hypothetical protein